MSEPTVTLTDEQKLEFYRSFALRSLGQVRRRLEELNPDYKLPPPRPKQTTMGPPSGYGPASYAGKQFLAGSLIDDTLTVIDGWPAFADYATDWEKKWSVLCDRQHQFPRGSVCHPDGKVMRATFSPYHAICAGIQQFTPVAATNSLLSQFEFATVVGHIGTVRGGGLITDGPTAGSLGARALGEEDGQVFVAAGTTPDGWTAYGNDEQEFTVFVTLTGQVTAILAAGATGFVEKPLLDPLDALSVGRLLVGLGAKGGSKLVSVLYRVKAGKPIPTSLPVAVARPVGKATGLAAAGAPAAAKPAGTKLAQIRQNLGIKAELVPMSSTSIYNIRVAVMSRLKAAGDAASQTLVSNYKTALGRANNAVQGGGGTSNWGNVWDNFLDATLELVQSLPPGKP